MKLARLCLAVGLVAVSASTLHAAGNPNQSPIDIKKENMVVQTLDAINFDYGATELGITNPGGSHPGVKALYFGSDTTITLTDPDTLDETTYVFNQFHFHYASEHKLNGAGYDMEMHLVHHEVGNPDNLLVIGRWIKGGATAHDELNRIFGDLTPLNDSSYVIEDFDMDTLIPASHKSYRYTGSLTGPEDDPKAVVQWIMFDEVMAMSNAQVTAFQTFLNNTPNARGLQGLNGRTIMTDVPTPSAMALLALAGFVGARRRR